MNRFYAFDRFVVPNLASCMELRERVTIPNGGYFFMSSATRTASRAFIVATLLGASRGRMKQCQRCNTREKITDFHAPQPTESKDSTFFGSHR